jgi:hypothetical protein
METSRTDERLGQAINNYLNHYVLVTDGKAVLTATASLVLIGFVVAPEAASQAPTIRWVGGLFAAVSAVLAGTVVYPRTPHSGSGHLFWGDIQSFKSANAYWKSLSTLSSEDIGVEYARQNFNVSGILNQKIRSLQRAMWSLLAACALVAASYGGVNASAI